MSSLSSKTPEERNFLAMIGFIVILTMVIHLNIVYIRVLDGEMTYLRYIAQAIAEGALVGGFGVWLLNQSGKI